MARGLAWFDSHRAPLQSDLAVLLQPRSPAWLGPLWLGLGYAALAGLSVLLSRKSGGLASLWFANALAMGVLAHRAPNLWWPALLAVALANASVNLAWGDPWLTALSFVPPNLAEILLGVCLLRLGGLHRSGVRSPWLMLRLLFLGGMLPQILGASLGALVVTSRVKVPMAEVWLSWFQGSVIGAVSVLPLVCCGLRYSGSEMRAQLAVPAMACLLPATVGAALLIPAHMPFPFVYLSFVLLLAALLLELLAVSLLSLVLSVTLAAALVLNILVPPPTIAAWQNVFVYLAFAATVLPAVLLGAAVAELRDSEAQLRRRGLELERANAGLEQFVRIASHDMREPLNTIAQFTGLVLDDHRTTLPVGACQQLGLVQRAALRMRTLLDDVLQYTHLQRGAPDWRPEDQAPVSLDEVLAQVRQGLAARLSSSGAQLQLMPLPHVLGQASLLQLIFGNLVGNALKFVAPGQAPQVLVHWQREGAWALVRVQDKGIGIAPADADKLFKPFVRLNLRREYEGTGLGLSLARQLACAQGGELSLVQGDGPGACFELRLRLADDQRTRSPGSAPPSGSSR